MTWVPWRDMNNQPITPLEWERLDRKVALDVLDDGRLLSTVLTLAPLAWPDLIFETAIISNKERDLDVRDRYADRKQAKAGHYRILKSLKEPDATR